MIKKKSMSRLCTIAIISCLAIVPVFAVEEINYEKEIIKAVKQDKVENVTPEYLDNIDILIYKQAYENQDFKKALKTADYRVKAKKNLYGENSVEARDAYFAKAELAIHAGLPEEAYKALTESKKIVQATQKRDADLRKKVRKIGEIVHSSFENSSIVVKIIKKSVDKQNQRELDILSYMSQGGQVKLVLKELKKLENKAIKAKDSELLANVYSSRINLLCEVNNYKEMLTYIEKAEKMLGEYPDLKGAIDSAKVTYYKEMSQHDKAIEYLNTNYLKDTYNDKLSYYYSLFDVLQDAKDYKEANKTINKLEKLYLEKYSEDSLMLLKMAYERKLNLYQTTKDDDKFEEYIEKYRKIVEPIKDKAPILYARYLEKVGKHQAHERDYEGAKNTLTQAIKIYEQYEPQMHDLAFLYSSIANIEGANSNHSKAIEYVNKAIEHNSKYYSDTNKDIADYYIHLSFLLSESGNFEKAKIYLNKGITIYRMIYGDDNVNTLQKRLCLYYLLKRNNKIEEANDILANINEIVYADKFVGYEKIFSYDMAVTNATVAVENNETTKALDYLKEAQKFIDRTNRCQKVRVNHLKYDLYKNSGNKIKALRYKKLAGIED